MVKRLTVKGVCAGGNHVFVEVEENGLKRVVVIDREYIFNDDVLSRNEEEAIANAIGRELQKEIESERIAKLQRVSNLPL